MAKNSKGNKTMTPETQVTETATTETATDKKLVKRTLFNLDSWKRESKEKTIEVPKPVKTFAEVLEALGNDAEKLVPFYNAGALRMAVKEAKREMREPNMVSPKIISGLVAGWYAKFPLTYTGDDKKKLKAAREEQREKVYEFVRNQEAMANAYRLIALGMTSDGDDEDEDEDEGSEG